MFVSRIGQLNGLETFNIRTRDNLHERKVEPVYKIDDKKTKYISKNDEETVTFYRDLPIGQHGEFLVQQILAKINVDVEFNHDKYYDIKAKIGKENVLIEVKLDLYAEKSGNIAIEFYNPKTMKFSGINITEANLWAHIVKLNDEYQVWLANVNLLKCFIEAFPAKRIIECGGDNNASLYLYDKDYIFDKVFVRIDNMETNELAENLRKIIVNEI